MHKKPLPVPTPVTSRRASAPLPQIGLGFYQLGSMFEIERCLKRLRKLVEFRGTLAFDMGQKLRRRYFMRGYEIVKLPPLFERAVPPIDTLLGRLSVAPVDGVLYRTAQTAI
jgi:hypothetical protein